MSQGISHSHTFVPLPPRLRRPGARRAGLCTVIVVAGLTGCRKEEPAPEASEAASIAASLPGELDPNSAPAWLHRAEQAMKRGEHESALGLLDRYLALEPQDPYGHLLRARIHLERNDPTSGAESIRQARKLLPEPNELDAFRKDQRWAREICRQLRLPELPDISGIDAGGQEQFYAMLNRLRLAPHDADEYGLLGQLYEAQKFPDLAIQLYHRAIETAPRDYKWHYQLGLRLAGDGKIGAAEASLKRAGELNPDFAPVWMHLAWRAVERNDPDGALAFINRYIQLRPQDPFGYVQRAQLHFDQGRWETMVKDLTQAKALEDEGQGHIGKQGHRLLGALYQHLGRPDDSKFHLQMSAQRLPGGEMDDPVGIMVRRLETFRKPLLTKLDGLVNAKRYRDALGLVDELLATYPRGDENYGAICGKIAECYRQTDDYANAARYAVEACRAMPDQAPPYAELALILVNTGKFAPALEAADKALALDPELHVALYARGLTLIQLAVLDKNAPPDQARGDPEAAVALAVEDLQRCAKREPLNLSYLVALATAHGMLGHFGRADELLTTALRISPNDGNTRSLKAKVETRQSFWPVLSRPATAPTGSGLRPAPE